MALFIILMLISLACFVLGIRQLQEKGFLLNNAWIYASRSEREKLDKKPHYRQSGIVFMMIGVIFALNAVDVLLKASWIFPLVVMVVAAALVYAIVSSIMIERKKK